MNEKELRQKFVKQAVAYVGVGESSTRHKEIVDTYNKIVPLPLGYKVRYTDAWCATFVSCVAKLCGLLDIIPAECSCPRQIELWKKLGRWIENDAYVPDVGDIIYYYFKDNGKGDCTGVSDHVGIVVSVTGNSIKVIEGNKSDSVSYRTITVDARYIRGYGCPDFASRATTKISSENSSSEEMCSVEVKVLRNGSKGNSVKALQLLLIGNKFFCGTSGADGDFGANTLKAVKSFQKAKGLEQDGIVGKMTWTALLS